MLLEKRLRDKIKKEDFIRTPIDIQKQKNSKPGPKTPNELLNDIEYIIEVILDPEEEPNKEMFLNSKNEIVVKRVIDFAMADPQFNNNWVDETAALKDGGYSKRTLQTHFSNVYEKMKSSISS